MLWASRVEAPGTEHWLRAMHESNPLHKIVKATLDNEAIACSQADLETLGGGVRPVWLGLAARGCTAFNTCLN